MRLFCIPHAGGLTLSFHPLTRKLKGVADVVAVELAGRGMKAQRTLYQTFQEAVNDVSADISENILHSMDEPYMILGHSMGSWLAYEVYYQLAAWGIRGPEHIILSGNNAPPKSPKVHTTYDLPEEEFIGQIMGLGYTNEEIFKDSRFRKKFLPYLRSDLRVTECYAAPGGRKPAKCGISILYGREDPVISEDLNKWREFAGKSFQRVSFEGGHFYIYERTDEVAETIKNIIVKRS